MRLIHVPEPDHKKRFERRKADKILEVKPDVILFENPRGGLDGFNEHSPLDKPKRLIERWKSLMKSAATRYPWLKAEHHIIEAIETLWAEGHQILLFAIDGPVELTSAGENDERIHESGHLNVVWNYLRERYMVQSIRENEHLLKGKTVLVFLHDFHWDNVQFLLNNPRRRAVLHHYFGRETSAEQIETFLKENNKTLYKHWKSISGF